MKTKEMKVAHINEDLQNKPTSENAGPEASSLYEVLKELPKPTTDMKLTASQKKWWYWFGLEFVKTKQFTNTDLMHLQNAAVMMDARSKMIKIINDENKKSANGVGGWVQRFSSGATNVTGYQTMYEKATKQLEDISAHFGLSIKDRKKLNATTSVDDSQLSLFEQMQQQLQQI